MLDERDLALIVPHHELHGAPQGVQKQAPQEWRASTHECATEFSFFCLQPRKAKFQWRLT